MKSKNILLAGLAVSALAAATGANALSLSGSTIGGVAVTGTPSANTINPYYIASETALGATGINGTASIDAHLTTGSITSGTFLVTFTVSGGATFNSAGITNANLTYGPTSVVGGTSSTVSTLSSTSVSFIVTVQGAASIADFVLSGTGASPNILNVASPTSATFTASVTSSGLPVDNGPASATLIAFTPGYAATVSNVTNETASVASNFKLFKANASTSSCAPGPDCAVAQIGTVNLAVASTPTGGAGGGIKKDLVGTPVANSDITGASVTETGNVGPTEAFKLNGATVVQGMPTAITAASGGALPATLTQSGATAATQSPLAQNGYSIAVTPTLGAGLTSSAASTYTLTLGSVTYEGINLNAAWVGDGTNGFDFRIRIGNYGAAINGAVQVTLRNPLNPGTSGTVASNVACTIQQGIPAGGEANISSAALKTCFGAFGRSDLIITVQGASTSLSAKMRIINGTTGVVNEQTLGYGITPAQLP